MLSFLVSVPFAAAMNEASNVDLKGMYSLYMMVDTSMANDVKASERLYLNVIMELQLLRG